MPSLAPGAAVEDLFARTAAKFREEVARLTEDHQFPDVGPRTETVIKGDERK